MLSPESVFAFAYSLLPFSRYRHSPFRRCANYEPGEVRCGTALVPVLLNSNVRLHWLSIALPSTVGGLNVHLRAACNARSAKYLLGPRDTKVACDTAPEVSTATFTFTLTVPVIVFAALGETSGKT